MEGRGIRSWPAGAGMLPSVRGVSTLLVVALALASQACSEDSTPSPRTPGPAELRLTVPSSVALEAGCSLAPQLERSGDNLGCGSACQDDATTCVVWCPRQTGLVSDTPHDLRLVYVVGLQEVAQAVLGAVTLETGVNRLTVPLEQVVLTDSDGDGTPDVYALCPWNRAAP
ncbi:MAG: hypothetical protein QM704_02265 [Anaeromyxobacteraceae bacterium]